MRADSGTPTWGVGGILWGTLGTLALNKPPFTAIAYNQKKPVTN